jgi:hypothetical protein
MGLAQILRGFHGEAEPRLTSGGEAATLPTKGLFVQSHRFTQMNEGLNSDPRLSIFAENETGTSLKRFLDTFITRWYINPTQFGLPLSISPLF